MVILDTSVIVDHIRQPGKRSSLDEIFEKYPNENFGISTITIQELYQGKSTREKEKEEILLGAISSFITLPYIYDTARLAGEISRDAPTPIAFADAAIAATAILNSASLLTLNKKDFEKIENLALL
ncbi:MAG: PIN domain-containing protein [Patescibacteria group bacterium]